MFRSVRTLLMVFCGLLATLSAQADLFSTQSANRPAFAPASQVFQFDFTQQGQTVTLRWKIMPGYYLYQSQLKVIPQHVTPGHYTLPAGQTHTDEFYGKTAIYRDRLSFSVPLQDLSAQSALQVRYQGCADAGFCYPPETIFVPLIVPTDTPASAPSVTPAPAEQTTPTHTAPFSPWWALLIGIGIAFTPCVLPMYPLLTGIILGGAARPPLSRILLLALAYVQGMAITYTTLGLLVAALGVHFQGVLQSPAVLLTLSVIFLLLALSMFGVYSLQLPSSLQTALTHWSNRQKNGSPGGVFVMGILAGLICSPCTTAPLSALLLWIAQSGDLLTGGLTLYLYALGMGIPLILVALFGHQLLPRSGPWMETVKVAFGFVILAMPVFLLERLLAARWGQLLWGALGVAFFGWALLTSLALRQRWARVVQLILLFGVLLCAWPLQRSLFQSDEADKTALAALPFQPIHTVSELRTALRNNTDRPVMLDLYADWCVACKELTKYTFSDPQVRHSLQKMLLLQADLTQMNAQDRQLLQTLKVPGLPALLFFDAAGREIPNSRLAGFMNARDFTLHLQRIQR